MKHKKCIRCNKNLKTFSSQAIGYGKKCLERMAEEDLKNQLLLNQLLLFDKRKKKL